MPPPRKPNRLINEKSPYLLQHAHNLVDWYPWGEEAFRKARAESKPVFLSVGYSTCHWCHVQARESFENEEIAEIINENFVPIKVDREERPEVDEIYMKAVTAMTGQGGWPLSVFLTPDLKPFYGGTYFPPVSRQGLPAFPDLLRFVSDLWKKKRGEVQQGAVQVVSAIRENYAQRPSDFLSPGPLDYAYAALVSSFDAEYGGYGGPPKFPLPTYVQFMLRYYLRSKKELALKSAVRTLDAIQRGGIRDHIGGGFHRYSTDRKWLIPHFEKMLYDNALLSVAYLEAHQLTGEPSFAETARDTLDWILNEMTDPRGGFHSAQDADTSEGEGVYYTWTREEVRSVLGEVDGEAFCELYGITAEGNFEGRRSVLHLRSTAEGLPSSAAPGLEERLRDSRRKLLQERLKRPRPSVDDKVLTSWNGLAISSLSRAFQVLRDRRYLDAAGKGAEFVVAHMLRDGTLYRRYRDGDVAIEGTLEDYAFFASGLLDLYEAGFETRWLERSLELARRMLELFWDEEGGGGFFLSRERKELIARVKDGYDGPTPSGNSSAAFVLLRLAELTGDEKVKDAAERTLKSFVAQMETEPSAHTSMLIALDFYFGPPKEIVIVPGAEGVDGMVRLVQSKFIPNKVLMVPVDSTSQVYERSPLAQGKTPVDGRTTAYVCENFSCKRPTNSLEALAGELGDAAPG